MIAVFLSLEMNGRIFTDGILPTQMIGVYFHTEEDVEHKMSIITYFGNAL